MKLSRKDSRAGRIESVSDSALKAVTGGVSLTFGHIEWTYTQQKRSAGAGSGNVTAKYDLVKAKGA